MLNYFAYGSNMSFSRMNSREINYNLIGKGILHDYELKLNKMSKKDKEKGFANISYKKGSFVEGIVYEIEDSSLKLLDKYEGYPIHYYRKNFLIDMGDYELGSIVYIATKDWTSSKTLKVDEEYKNLILEGKNLLSENYYNFLENLFK